MHGSAFAEYGDRWVLGLRGLAVTKISIGSFEAWQVMGPGGWRFVSLPGGELAVWTGIDAAATGSVDP